MKAQDGKFCTNPYPQILKSKEIKAGDDCQVTDDERVEIHEAVCDADEDREEDGEGDGDEDGDEDGEDCGRDNIGR